MKDLKDVKLKLKKLISKEVIINIDEYAVYKGMAELEGVEEHKV